jgi:hypothetical protein
MSDLRDAARQALEALEELNGWQSLAPPVASQVGRHAAIILRAALEQTVQEPLSDEELDRLWREPMSADWAHREFARVIEAAHGIKENT